jgi:putative ABC transport system permease protein
LRNTKRTIVLALSISLATTYMIFDLNFADSGSREMVKDLLSQYFGRLQITHTKYYPKDDTKNFNQYKTIAFDAPEFSHLKKVTPRITLPVMISGPTKTLGVLLVGVDPKKEKEYAKYHGAISEGAFFSSDNENQVIVGKKLAQKIGAKIGDEIALIGQALDGSLANDIFKLIGVIDFGGGDLEEALCFSPIKPTQEFASIASNHAHQLVDFDTASDHYDEINGYTTTPWKKFLPEIAVSISFIDHFTWIVSLVIVTVISLGLSNTLMISFLEREKELDALNIIGASPRWISISLIFEVFILATFGIILGVILGHFVTKYFYYHPINIEMFTGGEAIMMGGMTVAPLVRLYPVAKYYWQSPLLIYFYICFALVYPLYRVQQRSQDAG